MGLQAQLDQQMFDLLPRIKEIMKSVNQTTYDNMYAITMRLVQNSHIVLDNATKSEIKRLETEIINAFKYRVECGEAGFESGWLK